MIFRAVIKKTFIIFFFITLLTGVLRAQSADEDVYQKAESLQDNTRKIEALKNFISSYPESQRKADALLTLFSIYLDDNKTDTALIFAD